MKDANDLTNLVKRKKPAKGVLREETESGLAKSNGKRRVEFADEVVNVGTGKKARISEGDDE